jgi:prolyl oligopeptidase PreP (S9A serine peptidase family)
MRTFANRPHVQVLAALVLGSLAAYASAGPDPVKVENKQRLQATVTAIDLEKRLVSLKADNGNETTIEVSPEVTNLPQVKAGDKVVVDYYQGLGAAFKKKGESQTVGKLDRTDAVARAAPGEKPGAAVGTTVTTTVVIDAVDKAKNTVSFTGPKGNKRTVDVKDPSAQKFISQLKKGDEVELTYTEALAVSVQPKT